MINLKDTVMKKQVLLFMVMLLPMVVNADESGTCGANLTWKYDEATQALTISGTGPMTNYEYDATNRNHPWYRIHSYVSSIIIEEGVTTIGDNAFSRFWVRSVSIPSTITSIGKYAFLLSYIGYAHQRLFYSILQLAHIPHRLQQYFLPIG